MTTLVTINGNNFNGCTSVSFNGVPASFTVVSNNQITSTVPIGATTGFIQVATPGGIATSSSAFVVTNPPITLHLKVFLQGFYIGNGMMNSVVSNGNADNIIVRLARTNNPYSIAHSANGIIDQFGEGNFTFFGPSIGSRWYIVVQQRNTIETWSSDSILFNSLSPSYDFTTAQSKAYGNNQIEVEPGVFAIYSGDVNQDGFIGGDDVGSVDNDNLLGLSLGYFTTDLNGDGFVGGDDVGIVDNNNLLGVFMMRP